MLGDGLLGEGLEVASSGRVMRGSDNGRRERQDRASPGIKKGRSQGANRSPQRKSPSSLLHLAGVVASAFDRVEPRGPVGRLARRVDAIVALFGYKRRVHESGRALCLVGLRWGRVIGATTVLVVVAASASAISEVAAASLVVVLACMLLPLGFAAVCSLPSRARLSRQTPPGRHRYVHSLASTKRGAGADVLRALCVEADVKRWSLVLDAGSEALVGYYEVFGFRRCGSAVRVPRGRFHVRMVRTSGSRPAQGGQETARPGGK
jgi:hypothetical protein